MAKQQKKRTAGQGSGVGRSRAPLRDVQQIAGQVDQCFKEIVSPETSPEQRQRSMDRLVRLGPQGAKAIAARLRSGQVTDPLFELTILDAIEGGEQTHLEQLIEDRQVDPVVRLHAWLITNQSTLYVDPDELEAERVEILDSLDDPVDAIARWIEEASRIFPQFEVVAEALEFSALFDGEQQRELLGRVGPQSGALATVFVRGLLHAQSPATTLEAIMTVLAREDRGAIRALSILASTTPSEELRRRADEAVQRLRTLPATEPALPRLPPIVDCWISEVDEEGVQMAIVVRQEANAPAASFALAQVSEDGVLNIFGLTAVDREELLQRNEQTVLTGIDLVAASPGDARRLLAWGVDQLTAESERPPAAYEAWEPFFYEEQTEPMPEARPLERDDAPYRDRHDLLAESAHLGDVSSVSNWELISTDEIERRLESETELADEHHEQLINALIDEEVTPERLQRLRSWLRREAWTLDHLGATDHAQTALAAAAALAPDSGVPPRDHPLVRNLIEEQIHLLLESPNWADELEMEEQ